jgi:hypothetical protein
VKFLFKYSFQTNDPLKISEWPPINQLFT